MIARLLVSAALVLAGYVIGRSVNGFDDTRIDILNSMKDKTVSDEELLKEALDDDDTIA